MSEMKQQCCPECGGDLWPSDIKDSRKSCSPCQQKKRTTYYLSETYMNTAFSTTWGKELFKRLGVFLEEHEIRMGTRAYMLPKAAAIFREAEQCFQEQGWIEKEWLEERIKRAGVTLFPTFFRAFLVQEQILVETSQNEKTLQALQTRLAKIPQHYRRAMEVYFNERLAVRERQIKLNAKRPITLRTLLSDLDTLSRLVRWLTEKLPDLTGWDMVQEEHIHAFLLTLAPKTRELLRKDLSLFFRLARKRRLITHVPLMELPTRDLPRTVEPLSLEEQKILARKICNRIASSPEAALLSALCFYHGLSSSQICRLKTEHVDVERGVIYVEGRPPIYLLAEDFLLLDQCLKQRQELPYAKKKSYLFISNQTKLDDKPMTQEYVSKKVRALTGHTPQCLRITCFTALSARYGPQYLVEAFGLSLDQAARYGKMEEFLLEEEVKQQREAFLELSHQLEQSETQCSSRTRRKKEK
jgi:integrase